MATLLIGPVHYLFDNPSQSANDLNGSLFKNSPGSTSARNKWASIDEKKHADAIIVSESFTKTRTWNPLSEQWPTNRRL